MSVVEVDPVPVGHGLMVVYRNTATVVGEPGPKHGMFFGLVKHLADQHRKEGSPRSGGLRGEQFDL